MDSVIELLKTTTFAGKRFSRKQLVQIQQTVKSFTHLSHRELGLTLCENLNFLTPGGEYAIQHCLKALKEMESMGLFKLPEKQIKTKKGEQKPIKWSEKTEIKPIISGKLEQFSLIRVELTTDREEKGLFNEYIDRYHYLGYRRPIGNHLRYFIIGQRDGKETRLGCLLFSFAVNHLECRDRWIGWNDQQRQKHLPLVVNNTRFLIFPWVKVKNLASKSLSMAANQITTDWLKNHGIHPLLLETFVDTEGFSGTCYRAANWVNIGFSAGAKESKKTAGKSQKSVYIYPLRSDYLTILTQNRGWLKPPKHKKYRPATEPVKLADNDPFVALWQQLIGLVSQVANEFDAQWQQRRRVLNSLLLMLFIFRLVFSTNRQAYKTTTVELWAQCQCMNIPLPQTKPVAASAFCNARKKMDERIFKTLNRRIIAAYESNSSYLWCGRRLFAVDGMKINLPRSLFQEHYIKPSDSAHYPHGLVSCLYQLKSQIPYDFELSSHLSERRMAVEHLTCLKPSDVVVYDRGYYSYAMLYEHKKKGIDVIFRLAQRSGKIIDTFIESNQTEQLVEIEVEPLRRKKLSEQHLEIEFCPLPLRLIKYSVKGTSYVLGTTLLDQGAYPAAVFSDLYHARWGIEELYKISKQLLNVDEFHSQTERGVKQELFAHFVLLTMNRILSNHSEKGLNTDNKEGVTPSFQVNIKNALMTMARHIENLFLRQAKRACATLNTLITEISHCRHKVRLGRTYKRVSMKPAGKWQAS